MDEEEVRRVVDAAVEGMRRDWLSQIDVVATLCEAWSKSVTEKDAACGHSMEFVAFRLRRIIERERADV